MRVELICHPDHPSKAVTAVSVEVEPDPDGWTVRYDMAATTSAITLPSPSSPQRTDGLWESTCFEAFLMRPGACDYLEFNFSPSSQWAAYAFESYRAERQDIEVFYPPIVSSTALERSLRIHVTLPVGEGPWLAGLSAIIEEKDGTKSYWAISHPPGDPDFHDPEGFALELPVAL